MCLIILSKITKKAAKKANEEKLKEVREGKKSKISDDEETITISANSIEELTKKLEDYAFNERSDSVQTESEKLVGQHIDFKG